MKAPQLLCAAVAVALSVGACQKPASRAELKPTANETADRIKTESVKAGGKIEDVWIATKIQSKFVGDRDIRARDISVSSDGGVVTLRGHVLNESAHQLALTIANNTAGVKQVVDQLDVDVAGPPAPRAASTSTPGVVATTGTTTPTPGTTSSAPVSATASDDARITTSIQSKYFMDDRIKGRHINVTTHAGVVTLNGDVADETERAEALLIARTTEGVKQVEDSLNMSTASPATADSAPPVATADPDTALVDRVKSQLLSDSQLKNAPVEVTAQSGVVVLQGTVASSAAKTRALTVVRGTDGVTQVVDRIRVTNADRSSRRKAKR
jgi:osmotically-inducible protein OsmY